MADHVRQQIREQVATTVTGLATTGSNVFQLSFSRFNNEILCSQVHGKLVSSSNGDALVLFVSDETSETQTRVGSR